MDKKLEFNKALSSLIEFAAANGNRLSTAQISSAFDGILEDDNMLEHVFSYLAENKIAVTGYVNPLSESETSDRESAAEQSYIAMYLTDLEEIAPASAEEESALLKLAAENPVAARDRLTELNLRLVMEELEAFQGKGVATSDLIQEGNLGLMEGIATYQGSADISLFHSHLRDCIVYALQNALDEEIGAKRIGKHLADRANALEHFSAAFAKEHGRQATLEELAKEMGLSEDEVEAVIKHSLNALNSDGEEPE